MAQQVPTQDPHTAHLLQPLSSSWGSAQAPGCPVWGDHPTQAPTDAILGAFACPRVPIPPLGPGCQEVLRGSSAVKAPASSGCALSSVCPSRDAHVTTGQDSGAGCPPDHPQHDSTSIQLQSQARP